jgi:hypothetical protein
MTPYNPLNWYWTVNGSTTQVYSSAVGDYVPVENAAYQAWVAAGGRTTRIASEAELGQVLAPLQIRPASEGVLDGYKEAQANKLTVEIIAKVLFRLVNDVRVLQGNSELTAAQFKNFLKGLM